MPYQISLESFQGEKANSVINNDDIDFVLQELKVLFNHFNVIKIKKIKDK